MSAFLRVLAPVGPPDRIELPVDRPVLIGRGEGCELRIEHRSLSRLHCAVEFDAGQWLVSDCRSMNGTRVGGYRVTETAIYPGELIQIGDVRIEFSESSRGGTGSNANMAAVRYPLAGRYFGRFELLRCVHTGSGGLVFQAREPEKNREIALKILGAGLAVDESTRKRFERGARTAAPVSHPGIVQLYATGRTEGQSWLSMEWVDGYSLRELLAGQTKLALAEAVRITREVAIALESIAAGGIVHRNIKPSSILIARSGEIKITDFVLARPIHDDANQVTSAGEIVGDTAYLAPECFRAPQSADTRADIYSLGACLFEMVTGRTPFVESNISRLMDRVLREPAPAPSEFRAELPDALLKVIAACLATDPNDRFQTARELMNALESLHELTTAITGDETPARNADSVTVINETDSPDDMDEVPISLPSSVPTSAGGAGTWMYFPHSLLAPSPNPWATLFGTILTVVAVGSLVLFPDRLYRVFFEMGEEMPAAVGQGGPADPRTSPPTSASRPPPTDVPRSNPLQSKELKAALADPDRLIVQPGTPLRNISDAVAAAKDGQVIEVASNNALRGEVILPGKSLTIVANPEFHPIFKNTLRIQGGGVLRIEGFHFEPYLNKPAIEIEKMPDRLELVGCTFRRSDSVLINVRGNSAGDGRKTLLLVQRCFAAGNIIIAASGILPDFQLNQSCLVADQSILDWQLPPGGANPAAPSDITWVNNTLAGRSVFNVRLADQKQEVEQLPKNRIHLDSNLFVFSAKYPCTFFRWEAWRRPDIVLDRFEWSGSHNAFAGGGEWSMATTLVLSDPGATPQIVMKAPEDWQSRWAENVSHTFKVPPEFRTSSPARPVMDVVPADFEILPNSKQRQMGRDRLPIGANIAQVPAPPDVPAHD